MWPDIDADVLTSDLITHQLLWPGQLGWLNDVDMSMHVQ